MERDLVGEEWSDILPHIEDDIRIGAFKMGPYCYFCDQRCFVHLTDDVPEHILRAYGTSTIVATCSGGQAFEKAKVGYCYADIKVARRQNNLAAFFEAVGTYAFEMREV